MFVTKYRDITDTSEYIRPKDIVSDRTEISGPYASFDEARTALELKMADELKVMLIEDIEGNVHNLELVEYTDSIGNPFCIWNTERQVILRQAQIFELKK